MATEIWRDTEDRTRAARLAVTFALGGVATLVGARRGGVTGLLLTTLGSLAVRHAVSEGWSLARELGEARRLRASEADRAAQPPREVAADVVDEASWESFPASDPPSYTR